MPGKPHDLAIEHGKGHMSAPRAMQRVPGDFTIQVRISGTFQPGDPKSKSSAYNGAGILVRIDDANYLTLARATFWNGTTKSVWANFEVRKKGANVRYGEVADLALDNDKDTWLKIERRGNRFRGYASQDRGTWEYLDTKTLDAPAEVHVGVAAINTSLRQFAPRFSELELITYVPRAANKK